MGVIMEAGAGSVALLVAALPGATGAGAAKVTTGAGPATEGRMDSQALKEASATRVKVKRYNMVISSQYGAGAARLIQTHLLQGVHAKNRPLGRVL
jgi:hypothetical protein